MKHFAVLSLMLLLRSYSPQKAERPPAVQGGPSGVTLSGKAVIQRVNDRSQGRDSIKEVTMRLIDPNQQERRRELVIYQMNLGNARRTLYSIISPPSLRATNLLIYEGRAIGDDSVWLYLPNLDRIFQIKTAYRGHEILGTDFTYEDSKQDRSLTDYDYGSLKKEILDGYPCVILEGVPTSPQVTEETGVGRSRWWVREDIWMVVQVQFYDSKGEASKSYRAERIERIQGIWTPRVVSMENEQTHHKTVLEMRKVRYNTGVAFGKESLRKIGKADGKP